MGTLAEQFDLFLSLSNVAKPDVEAHALKLSDAGLDNRHFVPGAASPYGPGRGLWICPACVVFVGGKGAAIGRVRSCSAHAQDVAFYSLWSASEER